MKDGEPMTSFIIVTRRANAQVEPVHDRMPVTLSENQRE
jgi:putative SOS response-associated peptidase YedK